MTQMQEVVLRPAFAWDCQECGTEAFCRGIVPEMSPSESAALREEYGVHPWEEGDYVLMPEEVRCPRCGAVYRTIHYKDA